MSIQDDVEDLGLLLEYQKHLNDKNIHPASYEYWLKNIYNAAPKALPNKAWGNFRPTARMGE
jgi:hypothetical protein